MKLERREEHERKARCQRTLCPSQRALAAGACRAKTCLLIQLALLCCVSARLLFKEIQDICNNKMKLPINGKNHMINPLGPLNPALGYMVQKMNILPEIRALLNSTESGTLDSMQSVPFQNTALQNPEMDCSMDCTSTDETDAEKSPEEIYRKKYTDTFNMMFPSIKEGTLIVPDGDNPFNDAIIITHNNRPDDSIDLIILAALLLISEGYNIPLEFVHHKDSNHVLLTLFYPSSINNQNNAGKILVGSLTTFTENEKVIVRLCSDPVSEMEKIVDFFKTYRKSNSGQQNNKNSILFSANQKESQSMEAADHQEFSSGNYMNSPSFLIQTYIYEYIESKDMMKEFLEKTISMVYQNIWDIWILSGKTPSPIYGQKLDQCFKQIDPHETKDLQTSFYINDAIMSVLRDANINRELSFAGEKDCNDGDLTPTEKTLLGICCCFAFDREKEMYTQERFTENTAICVQEFFARYRYAVAVHTESMYSDWKKIMNAIISEETIRKNPTTGRIDNGLINIITAAIWIIHGPPEEDGPKNPLEAKNDTFKKRIKDIKKENTTALSSVVKEYVESVMKDLSVNINGEVSTENIYVQATKDSDNPVDVFGNVSISFREKDIHLPYVFNMFVYPRDVPQENHLSTNREDYNIFYAARHMAVQTISKESKISQLKDYLAQHTLNAPIISAIHYMLQLDLTCPNRCIKLLVEKSILNTSRA
ncbi:hypothetical protein NEAUS06_2294 [Nematocida ausubeli]|nr:hypothetical protein NEAUS06_2294 [Nematocida ausubeli]